MTCALPLYVPPPVPVASVGLYFGNGVAVGAVVAGGGWGGRGWAWHAWNVNWGGWGGRYLLRQPLGEGRAIWTQGGDSFFRVTSADTVDTHTSDQATIWRWRQAFQNDFAARMDWAV